MYQIHILKRLQIFTPAADSVATYHPYFSNYGVIWIILNMGIYVQFQFATAGGIYMFNILDHSKY